MEFDKRPTTAYVNLDHLRHNAKIILEKTTPENIMAIVKADAYGHGAAMVARTLQNLNIKHFGVATFAEGHELREQGIRGEIYILDGLMSSIQKHLEQRLYPVIYELDQLQKVCDYAGSENREVKIALKFDTGMGRLGFSPAHIDDIIKCLKKSPEVVVGLCLTHLACADEEDPASSERQFTLFQKLRGILKERGLTAAFSICNSAASLDGRLQDFDWVRPGIVLYGCSPHARFLEKVDLKPVMSLKTRIASLKKVPQNTEIGYGATFTTKRESLIAVLPLGYADGYPRLASNRGHVLIRSHKAPVVGRVSMDLITVDVTDVPDVSLYDEVTLIGQDGAELIRAEDVALWADTISYEILCGISKRVPRVYEGL